MPASTQSVVIYGLECLLPTLSFFLVSLLGAFTHPLGVLGGNTLFDPDQGIPAGRNWERELYPHLRKTDAVIFLASVASVTSRWCVVEVSLARLLGKPVFPLRLNDDARLELLDGAQWVDLADGER